MTLTVEQALENIYTSVNNDNDDLLTHIAALKAALTAKGTKDVTIDAARLTHNNREGRKLMQSFFRKHGINVDFTAKQTA